MKSDTQLSATARTYIICYNASTAVTLNALHSAYEYRMQCVNNIIIHEPWNFRSSRSHAHAQIKNLCCNDIV